MPAEPPKYVEQWPFRLYFDDLGYYFTYFGDSGGADFPAFLASSAARPLEAVGRDVTLVRPLPCTRSPQFLDH